MFRFAQPQSPDVQPIPRNLLGQMRLFEREPELVDAGHYVIRSNVDPTVVDLFFARVMGDTTAVVTLENAEQLRALCNELGFSGFDDEIGAVLRSDSMMRRDFVDLRSRVDRHDMMIEELQRRVLELEQQQRGTLERVEAVERRVEEMRRKDVEGAIAEVGRQAGSLSEDIRRLKSDVSGKVRALLGSEIFLVLVALLVLHLNRVEVLQVTKGKIERVEGLYGGRVESVLRPVHNDDVRRSIISWLRQKESHLMSKLLFTRMSTCTRGLTRAHRTNMEA